MLLPAINQPFQIAPTNLHRRLKICACDFGLKSEIFIIWKTEAYGYYCSLLYSIKIKDWLM
jgi:hypothetical protein